MYKYNRHIQNGALSRFKIHPLVALLLMLAMLLLSELMSRPLISYADDLLSHQVSPLGITAALTLRFLAIPFAAPLGVLFFWVKVVEGRKFLSLGFYGTKPLLTYLKGFCLGMGLISCYVLTALFLGAYELRNIGYAPDRPQLFLASLVVLTGWLLQGASEEILTRGWLLQTSAQKRVVTGILLSSSIFALLHLGNPGLGVLPLVNLVLYGLFACAYALYSENLWGICAFHSGWNWAQGNLFGISVSGNATLGPSLLVMGPPQGATLLTGGSFGAEGSLIVTGLLCLGTLGFLYLSHQKGQFQSDSPSSI